MQILEGRAYYNFIESIHSPITKRLYHTALQHYVKHYQLSLDDLLSLPVRSVEEHIIDYMIKQKGYQGKLMVRNALKKFYDMNDITLNWKKVSQYLGEYQRVVKDRAYTSEEIKKLVDLGDARIKAIILLLASTGLRIGALPPMTLSHLERKGNQYKITVYENSKEEYCTFTTPEAAAAIDEYLDYRKRSGENLRLTHHLSESDST